MLITKGNLDYCYFMESRRQNLNPKGFGTFHLVFLFIVIKVTGNCISQKRTVINDAL